MYKKILLSSAVAVAMGTAGVAQAAVDLDKPNGENPLTFAEETTIPAGGAVLDVSAAGGGLAVIADFGFTIGSGTSKYVLLEFDEPLTSALTTGAFTDSAGVATFSISQGGQAGDTSVIVEVAANTAADVLQDSDFQFAPTAVASTGPISATNKNTRNISYTLFETAVDAVNGTNPLVSKSGQWITWVTGYSVACSAGTPDRIDVVTPSQFLVNGDASTETLATASIGVTSGVYPTGVAPTAVTVDDYFTAGSTAVVEGNTDAFFANGGAITLNALTPTPAVAAGDNEATFVATVDGTDFNGPLNVTDDTGANETDMVPSSYTLSVTGPGTTFDVGTVTVDCGSLQYSGSTDRLDFALTPNGAFSQFVRITNPSQTDGDVTVTVYNDAGDSVTFPMGDIANVSSTLEAEGSTKLINVNDVYAAAQAADATFALAATGADSRNKLRIEVRGEFGDDATEDSTAAADRLVERRVDGIYIQGLTVSRDNNAFFQTK